MHSPDHLYKWSTLVSTAKYVVKMPNSMGSMVPI